MGGFLWAAQISDAVQVRAQERVLENMLRKSASKVNDTIIGHSFWSIPYWKIMTERDIDWYVSDTALYLWDNFGLDENYVIFDDGTVFVATVEGQKRPASAYAAIAPHVSFMVREAAARGEPEPAHKMDTLKVVDYTSGEQGRFRVNSHFLALPKGPALVTAATIQPDMTDAPLPRGPQPIMVSVYYLTNARLAAMGAEFDFEGLRWSNWPVRAPLVDHTIRNEFGTKVGRLAWNPVLASATLVREFFVPGLLILLLLGGATVLAIRFSGQMVKRLQASEAEARYKALHDPLTDLPNRRQFLTGIETAFADALP
jgi:hypothetical protein